MHIIIAKVVAKPAEIATVQSELLKLVEPTHKEQGCVEYRLHQDKTDQTLFIFYERWESEAHLQQHIESAHFKACMSNLEGRTEGLTIQELTALH